MASISINSKGSRIYSKFNDGKFLAVHLGKDKKTCIMMLKNVFKDRQYIEQGRFTNDDLAKFIQRIEDIFNN